MRLGRDNQARNVGRVIACGATVDRQYFRSGHQRDRLAALQKNEPREDGMTKIWMLTASCLVAASLFGPAAFAQNPEAEAAAAAARANAQISPNDSLEKICRIGP